MRIIEFREAQGWTKAELARQIGVHWNTVNEWEKGNHIPKGSTALRLLELEPTLEIPMPAKETKRLRRLEVYECADCKGPISLEPERYVESKLHTHHIIPLSEDGTNDIDNILYLCPGCHKRRHMNPPPYGFDRVEPPPRPGWVRS